MDSNGKIATFKAQVELQVGNPRQRNEFRVTPVTQNNPRIRQVVAPGEQGIQLVMDVRNELQGESSTDPPTVADECDSEGDVKIERRPSKKVSALINQFNVRPKTPDKQIDPKIPTKKPRIDFNYDKQNGIDETTRKFGPAVGEFAGSCSAPQQKSPSITTSHPTAKKMKTNGQPSDVVKAQPPPMRKGVVGSTSLQVPLVSQTVSKEPVSVKIKPSVMPRNPKNIVTNPNAAPADVQSDTEGEQEQPKVIKSKELNATNRTSLGRSNSFVRQMAMNIDSSATHRAALGPRPKRQSLPIQRTRAVETPRTQSLPKEQCFFIETAKTTKQVDNNENIISVSVSQHIHQNKSKPKDLSRPVTLPKPQLQRRPHDILPGSGSFQTATTSSRSSFTVADSRCAQSRKMDTCVTSRVNNRETPNSNIHVRAAQNTKRANVITSSSTASTSADIQSIRTNATSGGLIRMNKTGTPTSNVNIDSTQSVKSTEFNHSSSNAYRLKGIQPIADTSFSSQLNVTETSNSDVTIVATQSSNPTDFSYSSSTASDSTSIQTVKVKMGKNIPLGVNNKETLESNRDGNADQTTSIFRKDESVIAGTNIPVEEIVGHRLTAGTRFVSTNKTVADDTAPSETGFKSLLSTDSEDHLIESHTAGEINLVDSNSSVTNFQNVTSTICEVHRQRFPSTDSPASLDSTICNDTLTDDSVLSSLDYQTCMDQDTAQDVEMQDHNETPPTVDNQRKDRYFSKRETTETLTKGASKSESAKSEYNEATVRINTALHTLKSELMAMREQDLALLKQLINISQTIQRIQRSRVLRVSKSLSFSSSQLLHHKPVHRVYRQLERQNSAPHTVDRRRFILGNLRSSTEEETGDSMSSFDESEFDSQSEMGESTSSLNSIFFPNSPTSPRSRALSSSRAPSVIFSLDVCEDPDKTYEDILRRNVRLWKLSVLKQQSVIEEVTCLI